MRHHVNLGCRPEETISPYLAKSVQPNVKRQKYDHGSVHYSRTCPIQLTNPKTNTTIEGLAILDDQASITMIDPSVVEMLSIKPSDMKSTNLSTTTIEGTSLPGPCKLVDGLIVSALDGSNPVHLPSTYVYKRLPSTIHEVPSRETISAIPGLNHLAKEFIPKENWQTLVLIGRDCTAAQLQEDMTFSKDKRQIASKTPFGWVLIGEPTEHT